MSDGWMCSLLNGCCVIFISHSFSGQAYHESNYFYQVRTFGLHFSSLSFFKPVVNITAIIISFFPPTISDLWKLGNTTFIWIHASTSQDCVLDKLCTYHPLPSSQSSKVSTVRSYMHVGQEDVLWQVWKTQRQDCQLCYRGHTHWNLGIPCTSVLGACFLVDNPLYFLWSLLISLRSIHQKGKPLIHFSQSHIWRMPLSNLFPMVG